MAVMVLAFAQQLLHCAVNTITVSRGINTVYNSKTKSN